MEELSSQERLRLWLRLGLRLAITVLVVLLAVLAGPTLLSLFFPFLLALLLAWLLNPAVRFFQKKAGGGRGLWALALLVLLIVGVGGVLTFLGYHLVIQLRDLVNNWQGIWDRFLSVVEMSSGVTDWLFLHLPPEVGAWMDNLLQGVVNWLHNAIPTLLSSLAVEAGGVAMKLPSFLIAAVVFFMASYFIIADYPRIRALAVERMSADALGLLRFIKHTAASALGGYLRAQLLLSVGVFFILLAGFSVVGQSYALLLALLLAVMDFIPIIGAGTVMVPWAVVALFTGDIRSAVELLVIWGIIVLFRRVAEPKAVGDQTGLSPILSLVSIYVGMKINGLVGMILGPVLLLVFLNVCRAGVFDAWVRDAQLAVRDLRILLKEREE